MSAEVVEFDGITTLDIPPARVLSKAVDAALQSCVVIGYREDGSFYFASSVADGGEVLWLMEVAKKRLLEVEV